MSLSDQPDALTTISYDLIAADILRCIRQYAVREDHAVRYIALHLQQAHQRGAIEGMQRYDRILTEAVDGMTGGTPQVSCSKCGQSFAIPGREDGFSSCAGHSGIAPLHPREVRHD